jgi:hypothetical protein
MPLDIGSGKRVPSQRWMTFVRNHAQPILACDFFIVVTARFRILSVFVAIEVGTRRIGTVKKSIAAIASRWFHRKLSQRFAGSGFLGARRIQRETVLSEMSNPSIKSSPWIRGAPQVGFSRTIRKIRSRTSIEILLLPIIRHAPEITRQYKANPALCHRTTVSGFTTMRACSQPDQNLLTKTQRSLSNVTSRGLGCLRFETSSCCRRARFSSMRLRRVRKTRRIDAKRTRMRGSMARRYRESLVKSNGLCC